MAISPALAASAYQAVAKIGADSAASSAAGTAAAAGGPDFSQFLSHAVNDAVGTMKQGEQMAAQQATGKGDIVNVVNAVNAAELTLDTVVAIRDKVISAYQSIMQMPI
jgi:flagellar hook-basal body complex protein FliE